MGFYSQSLSVCFKSNMCSFSLLTTKKYFSGIAAANNSYFTFTRIVRRETLSQKCELRDHHTNTLSFDLWSKSGFLSFTGIYKLAKQFPNPYGAKLPKVVRWMTEKKMKSDIMIEVYFSSPGYWRRSYSCCCCYKAVAFTTTFTTTVTDVNTSLQLINGREILEVNFSTNWSCTSALFWSESFDIFKAD